MYRRLEANPEKMAAQDNSKQIPCICQCKSVQAKDREPQPDATYTGTRLSVDFDING